MKNAQKLVLLVASAALLSACGSNNTPAASSTTPAASSTTPAASSTTPAASSSEVTPGASVYGGLHVDYSSDPNLLTVAVFGDSYAEKGGYVYTPKENEWVYLVPTFSGSNELDYVDIDGTQYPAETGAEGFTWQTYMGTIDLSGQKYVKFRMPKSVKTISVKSKANDAVTHKVTINITDHSESFYSYDTESETWGLHCASNSIDSYFQTVGTHETTIAEGAMGGYLIQGSGLEYFHGGAFNYSAAIGENEVSRNTLEASINNQQKTTALFKMGTEDVTINVKMSTGFDRGEVFYPCHGGSYIAKAEVETVTAMNYDTEKLETSIVGAYLNEVLLPMNKTIADADLSKYSTEDYVTGKATSHGSEVTQNWYKTIKFGDYTATASADASTGYLSYDLDWTNPAIAKAYYEAAVLSAGVTVELKDQDDLEWGASLLSKEECGYWPEGGTGLGWKANRNATIAAFMEYGCDGIKATTKSHEGDTHWYIPAETAGEDEDVDTGATWNDLNSDTTDKGYKNYATLLCEAYTASVADVD